MGILSLLERKLKSVRSLAVAGFLAVIVICFFWGGRLMHKLLVQVALMRPTIALLLTAAVRKHSA